MTCLMLRGVSDLMSPCHVCSERSASAGTTRMLIDAVIVWENVFWEFPRRTDLTSNGMHGSII